MNLRTILFTILLASEGIFAAKTNVVLFPLRNESDTILDSWIGYGFAETAANTLRGLDGFRVWDPVFIAGTDSTNVVFAPDSIVRTHRNRWSWDVAIGGSYRVVGDTVIAALRVFWSTGKEDPMMVEVDVAGPGSDFFSFCNKAVSRILDAIQYRVAPHETLVLQKRRTVNGVAYRTFAAGYGFEMHKRQNAALTAYARAEEIDPRSTLPSLRAAALYRASNDFVQARAALDRGMARSPADPAMVAAMADLMVETDAPVVAARFVSAHRALLETSAEGLKAIGKMYVASGEYQRAIALLTKAVAFGPGDLDVQFSLGTAYLAAGDYSRAIDIFNQLIQYRSRNLRYYASLGGAYRKAGKLMESTLILEAAEKMAPDNTTILVDLAHTYMKLAWYDKAGQLLVRARDVSPLFSDITINLGVVYWNQGRKKDEALQCFEQATANASTRQAAFNNLGTAHFFGGATGKAIEAYRKANATGHKNETVLYNLAMAYYAGGRLKKAVRYFDQMLSLNPDRLDVLLLVSNICVSLKRFDDAERYFHKIIEILPDHETALRGLADILVREKRYKEAIQPVEQFLERQPLNREFMVLVADIYRKMDWHEVALMRYQSVIKEFPSDSSGYLGAGECMYLLLKLKGTRDFDNTISVLKKAAELAPRNPYPDMQIGDIYAEYKNYHELAVEHWKKALGKSSDKKIRKMLERKIAG